jgi:lambda repressor-like predicted transcriptional regulator
MNNIKDATGEVTRELSSIFAKYLRAYLECSEEVQAVIREMAEIAGSPDADEQEREMALGTLVEALFPDYEGGLGMAIEEAEKLCAKNTPEGRQAAAELDAQEQAFADRLRRAMQDRGLTQTDLARRAGVQQPAISMMLTRNCRPQQRTIARLAAALNMSPEDLWPPT